MKSIRLGESLIILNILVTLGISCRHQPEAPVETPKPEASIEAGTAPYPYTPQEGPDQEAFEKYFLGMELESAAGGAATAFTPEDEICLTATATELAEGEEVSMGIFAKRGEPVVPKKALPEPLSPQRVFVECYSARFPLGKYEMMVWVEDRLVGVLPFELVEEIPAASLTLKVGIGEGPELDYTDKLPAGKKWGFAIEDIETWETLRLEARLYDGEGNRLSDLTPGPIVIEPGCVKTVTPSRPPLEEGKYELRLVDEETDKVYAAASFTVEGAK